MTYFCSIGSQILYIFETHGIGQTPSSLERYLVILVNVINDLNRQSCDSMKAPRLEMCMGMGKTGIVWVPWDSHGNGNKISYGIGMGWEWE